MNGKSIIYGKHESKNLLIRVSSSLVHPPAYS